MCGDAGEEFFSGVGQPGVKEGSGDEVEAASAIRVLRFPGGDVGDGEFGGGSAGFGSPEGTVDGCGRQVDAGGVPAVLGHPDDVGAFTAADVEDAAGGHFGDDGHEGLVRVSGPDGVVGLGVALFPGGHGIGHA